jgi:hypothetical protein
VWGALANGVAWSDFRVRLAQTSGISPAPAHHGSFVQSLSRRRHPRELFGLMPDRHKAEGMTRRIGEDARAVGRWLMAELRGA